MNVHFKLMWATSLHYYLVITENDFVQKCVVQCCFYSLRHFFIFSREQLNKTSKSVGKVRLMDHTQGITDLLAQINAFQVSATIAEMLSDLSSVSDPSLTVEICFCVQRNEAKLSEDIHRLRQEKQALEVDLQLMKKERDLAKAQAVSASGKTGYRAVLVVELKSKYYWKLGY